MVCLDAPRVTLCCRACARVTSHLRVKVVQWRVVRGVWGVQHGGVAWGLVMQHCGIATEGTRLG